jgi:hypothetical protein
LFNDLRSLSQAAIQNGQATIADLITISQSESVQEIARKLEDSARKIREENQQMQQQQLQQQQQAAQLADQQAKMKQEFEMKKHEDEIAVKREQIQANIAIAALREEGNNYRTESGLLDSDSNGIADELDLRRTEVEENYKNENISLQRDKLAETERSNKANEELKAKALEIQKNRPVAKR